ATVCRRRAPRLRLLRVFSPEQASLPARLPRCRASLRELAVWPMPQPDAFVRWSMAEPRASQESLYRKQPGPLDAARSALAAPVWFEQPRPAGLARRRLV